MSTNHQREAITLPCGHPISSANGFEQAVTCVTCQERYTLPLLIRQLLSQARTDAIGEVEAELKEQRWAAKQSVNYQRDVTKNAGLEREWKGTVLGIELCIARIQHLTDRSKG